MSGYTIPPGNGKAGYTYHTDRSVCDVGDGCDLPTTEQKRAQDRAEARADWYVIAHTGHAILGPVSESSARQGIQDALAAGHQPQLLRVVEDYVI